MTQVREVLVGSTEKLIAYPPFDRQIGRPSSADIRLGTPSTTMPDAGSESAAVVDPVSTTVSAAADRGDRILILASAAGIENGRYFLVADEGEKYLVMAVGTSGATVQLAEPLLEDISSGATFEGLALETTLTAAQTSDAGVSFAIWRATIDGVLYRWDHEFRVVTSKFPIPLTPDRLLRRSEVRRLRPSTDLTLSELILSAWEDVVRKDLRGRGVLEQRINTPAEITPALIEACLWLLKRGADRSPEEIESQERTYQETLRDVLASRRYWYSEEADEVASDSRQHLDPATEVAWLTR